MSQHLTKAIPSLIAFVVCTSVASAQWTVDFPDSLTSGNSNTQPFAQSAQFTQFIQYPGLPSSPSGGATTSLAAQGVVAGARLTQLALVPFSAGSGTYASNNAIIHIGHVVGTSSPTGWYGNLVNPVVLWDSTIDGPLTFPWTGQTWTPYISNPTAIFQWDGVNDVGINISVQPAGAVSNNFNVTTPPTAIYIRHGCSTTYNAPPGTAQTTTGVLGMRQRMMFDPGFTMFATTTGGGTGDLLLLPPADVPAGMTEGFTFITANTTGPIGSGPAFGIIPDAITFDILLMPALPGNPLHFVPGFTTLYPDASFFVSPGTLSFLAGQSWRMVTVAFGSGLTYLGRSNVVQLNW